MANTIKKTVWGWMEKAFLQEGVVTGIRKWNPDSMVEIDLHLSGVDMSKWQTIQRLKCKVSEFEFRDYTPARWNVEKKTCTLYVETSHQGDGSFWAKTLKTGDRIYFSPAHAAQLLAKSGKVLCIADGSALGHFMALKQLIDPKDYPLEALIVLGEEYTVPDDLRSALPGFEWLYSDASCCVERLTEELKQKAMQDYTSVFIAGNMSMVSALRKFLKKNSYLTARVVAHGFWK